jgi:hypothetical protein
MEVIELEKQSLTVLESAKAMVVSNAAQYAAVGEFVVGCNQLIDRIKSEFAEPKRKAHEAHKSIVAMETNALRPVELAKTTASTTALTWKREEDRIAKEQHDQQEALRRQEMESQKLGEAEVLEAWGETDAAAQKLSEALAPVRPAKFESIAPKVEGLVTRKAWKARVVQHSKVVRLYCLPDQTLINNAVKNWISFNKDPTPEQIKAFEAEIGGVEIYQDETFAGRKV